MNAVTVQYFDESKGFWRFGYLVKADLKWACMRAGAKIGHSAPRERCIAAE